MVQKINGGIRSEHVNELCLFFLRIISKPSKTLESVFFLIPFALIGEEMYMLWSPLNIQANLPFNFGEMHRVSAKILSPFNADCGRVQQRIAVQTH